jgi:hypothetical protein
VRSSDRGREICARLEQLFEWHASQLFGGMQMEAELMQARESLLKLEGFWSSARHALPSR